MSTARVQPLPRSNSSVQKQTEAKQRHPPFSKPSTEKDFSHLEKLAKEYALDMNGPDYRDTRKESEAQSLLERWYALQKVNVVLAERLCNDKKGVAAIKEKIEARYALVNQAIHEYFERSHKTLRVLTSG